MAKPDLYWRRKINWAQARGDTVLVAYYQRRRQGVAINGAVRQAVRVFRVWGEQFLAGYTVGIGPLVDRMVAAVKIAEDAARQDG